jgi:glutathione synthase
MSRICSPIHSSLVRLSQTTNNNELISEKQITGELGIFGSLISQNESVIYERIGGSLFRSKPHTNIEGGIATGQGYIDSILLV